MAVIRLWDGGTIPEKYEFFGLVHLIFRRFGHICGKTVCSCVTLAV